MPKFKQTEKGESSLGIFWVVADLLPCNWENTAKLIAFSISETTTRNSKNALTLTHKNSWSALTKSKHAWNYYPRGRVERRNGRVIVFASAHLSSWADYRPEIVKKFSLQDDTVRFVFENDKHYHCFLDDETIK